MGPIATMDYSARDSRQTPAPSMGSTTQMTLMYLMERLDEPLHMGARGEEQDFIFDVEMAMQNPSDKMTAETVREEVNEHVDKMGRKPTVVKIPLPKMIPRLDNVRAAVPRKASFSFFYPAHQNAMHELYLLFMRADSLAEFIATAAYVRDNPMINPRLFLYSYTKACLSRPDTRGFKFPALFEVMPDVFINTIVVKEAEEMSGMPMAARKVLTANGPSMMAQAMGSPDEEMNPDANGIIPQNNNNRTTRDTKKQMMGTYNRSYTGRDFNPENKMAYFREDMGVNSHHHHWHVIYDNQSKQDRRGELFYYMHHNLIARYDAERLSNGLSRVRLLDLTCAPIIEEGYFSHLTAENSKMAYAGRQANTPVVDVDIPPDPDAGTPDVNRINIQDMRKIKDRIMEAIDTGYLVRQVVNGDKVELTKEPLVPTRGALGDPGINTLGNVVEANGLSINRQFYGAFGLHVDGHRLMANLHDPRGHHKESYGAVGDLPTAMRDPAFYRWHKFIDEIFEQHKVVLQPYTTEQLTWDPIEVKAFSVQTLAEDTPEPNVLRTHWMQSDIDLGRGLDIRKSLSRSGAIWARVTHLNHDDFEYRINVENKTPSPVEGTFRIFMAPRNNEHGQRLYYHQQRLLFFEMDKFRHTIQPGAQEVTRLSTESSITIPWEQSFKSLETQLSEGEKVKQEFAVCGCGWPQHMLLPRGVSDGLPFDLFVMVTNAAEDTPPELRETNPDVKCKESLSFCGVLNKKYPDTKPMGFPFDRNPQPYEQAVRGEVMAQIPPTLDDYVQHPENKPNMKATQVMILHQPRVFKIRPGGAPPTMAVRPPERATSKRTKEASPQRSGRDSPDYFDDDFY